MEVKQILNKQGDRSLSQFAGNGQEPSQQDKINQSGVISGEGLWEFADVGFDTGKKVWFLQLFDSLNQNVGFYTAKNISMNRGCAIQYQWKDTQGRPFWHVRERFMASEVEGFNLDMKGNLIVNFKKDDHNGHNNGGNGSTGTLQSSIPKNFSYLQYAYHLTSNPSNENKAPNGFVEFCNDQGEVISRVNNKWIIIEDVNRRTSGEFPKIRIRIERKDVGRILLSRSTIIIMSKDGTPSEQF